MYKILTVIIKAENKFTVYYLLICYVLYIFLEGGWVDQDQVMRLVCFFGSLSVFVLLLKDILSLRDMLPEP